MTESGVRPIAAIAHMCHNILTRGYGSRMTARDLAREIQSVLPADEVRHGPTDPTVALVGRLLENHYGGDPLVAVDLAHDWQDIAGSLVGELRADGWIIVAKPDQPRPGLPLDADGKWHGVIDDPGWKR